MLAQAVFGEPVVFTMGLISAITEKHDDKDRCFPPFHIVVNSSQCVAAASYCWHDSSLSVVLTLRMEAKCSSKTSPPIRTTWWHVLGEDILQGSELFRTLVRISVQKAWICDWMSVSSFRIVYALYWLTWLFKYPTNNSHKSLKSMKIPALKFLTETLQDADLTALSSKTS